MMHRSIRDDLEEMLAGKTQNAHLSECEECRGEVAAMREQAAMLRSLRTQTEPEPGFYARVIERIEIQRAGSVWNVLAESPFSRRIAVASIAMALLLGGYLVKSEEFPGARTAAVRTIHTQPNFSWDDPALALPSAGVPDRDSVLANLVTYRGQ